MRLNTLGSLALQSDKTDEPSQRWSGKGELLVPVLDKDGRLWAAQSIDDSGRKSFPRGGRLQGRHFSLGDTATSDTILIAEGYATAATLHALTGLPVIVAFYSGNLPAVAEIYRAKFPGKILVIAGDNDHAKHLEKNVGRLKAQEAAQAVGGYALLPEFEKDAPGSDWNDLWKAQGTDHTQLQVGLNQAHAKHQATRELEKGKTASRTVTPEKALAATGGRSLTL